VKWALGSHAKLVLVATLIARNEMTRDMMLLGDVSYEDLSVPKPLFTSGAANITRLQKIKKVMLSPTILTLTTRRDQQYTMGHGIVVMINAKWPEWRPNPAAAARLYPLTLVKNACLAVCVSSFICRNHE